MKKCLIILFVISVFVEVLCNGVFANGSVITEERGNTTIIRASKDPFYLAELYNKLPAEKKQQIKNEVLNYSDKTIPLYYMTVSEDLYPTDKDKSAFLYLFGLYRAGQDVLMCKDTTAQQVMYGWAGIAPHPANRLSALSKAELVKVYEKVLEADAKHPGRPTPEWVCYHGLGAISGNVETLPMNEYKEKQDEMKQAFMTFIRNNKR